MKLFIILSFLIYAIFSSIAASAWELPKVGVEGKIEEFQQAEILRQHRHDHEQVYVFNTEQDVVDREFMQAVKRINGLKPGERYNGQ